MNDIQKEIKALDKALLEFKVFKQCHVMHYIEQGNKQVDRLFNSTSNVANDFHLEPNKQLNFD